MEQSQKQKAALVILHFLRNIQGKKVVQKCLRNSIDDALEEAEKKAATGLKLFMIARKLTFVFQSSQDQERLYHLFRLLLKNMDREALKGSYLAVSLDQRYSVPWILNMKKLLGICCEQLGAMKKHNQPGRELLDLNLNVLILFTDYTLWKFTAKLGNVVKKSVHLLCSKLIEHLAKHCSYYLTMQSLLENFILTSYLTGHSIMAIFGFRQLALCQLSPTLLLQFSTTLLTVPGCVLVLQNKSPESLPKLQKIGFAAHLLKALATGRNSFASMGINSVLSALGNVVNICVLDMEEIQHGQESTFFRDVLLELIRICKSSCVSKSSSVSSWHPFFGWIKTDIDRRNIEGLSLVQKQLQRLWHGPPVQILIGNPLRQMFSKLGDLHSRGKRMLIFGRRSSSLKPNDPALAALESGCAVYMSCLELFPTLSTDILVGLSCNGDIICNLWHILSDLSCLEEERAFRMLTDTSCQQPSLSTVLTLAIQATQYLIATLDDEELHVKQLYFSVNDLKDISLFLKQLVYKMIVEESLPPMYQPCLALLTTLHSRDNRRSFTGDPNFWIEKKVKISSLVKDIKLNKCYAKKVLNDIPFAIPFKKRINIFMDNIKEDKLRLGLLVDSHQRPATYITIRRGRILEGGYEQLCKLPVTALKGTIRVKFVNEQGLDEAGIDETGVFKEFLEDFISSAFNPSLGLFKVSSNGLLYPSPSSSVQENHLSLFECIGRILGKAVYEGIVVDVQFAQFFLSQILEHHLSSLYSSLDELTSLDPDVYKSLTYIKHAETGIEDLCLSFCWDEEVLGQVVTHELIPGGRLIEVTAENRICYVHRMAHFMLYTRLKQQSVAFLKGFHSIIDRAWISTFTPNELQSIVSGEQVELDVDDLRKHVEYFGGYHPKHQVITWLWDIVRNEFNAKEKKAFLKFVTSCSRPPLLGFSQLQPRFSIRCVDIREQDDVGDTLGSVLKGFFLIRRSDSSQKLPSASTCFNLLKLPNYRKKALLRDKLKYAISANAGFELS